MNNFQTKKLVSEKYFPIEQNLFLQSGGIVTTDPSPFPCQHYCPFLKMISKLFFLKVNMGFYLLIVVNNKLTLFVMRDKLLEVQ